MRPIRLHYMHELMRSVGLLEHPNVPQAQPRPATDDELARFHGQDYIDVVRTLSSGGIVPGMFEFGIGPGDNPPREGMYESSVLTVGSTLVATEMVESGATPTAFAPAGGVHHHAMPNRASGFGVFNDAVVAIKWLEEKGYRVAYVDIDCHHGDGVQHGFYDSDRVLTVSIHESGEFLFPGSGFVQETGTGRGEGYSVNVPLAPYTPDSTWHEAFDATVLPVIRAFEPDFLFTQLGIDTHYKDPLTHLSLTTQGFNSAVAKLGEIGGDVGRWVAVGGGGYDMSAVARAWTMALATMAGAELPNDIPDSFTAMNGVRTFADDGPDPLDEEIGGQVRAYMERTVSQVQETFFKRFGIS